VVAVGYRRDAGGVSIGRERLVLQPGERSRIRIQIGASDIGRRAEVRDIEVMSRGRIDDEAGREIRLGAISAGGQAGRRAGALVDREFVDVVAVEVRDVEI
jgi:hypothetical protein